MSDSPKKYKKVSYTVSVDNLRDAMIQIHLNFLHTQQLDMIDEAVERSSFNESRDVINHIMGMK